MTLFRAPALPAQSLLGEVSEGAVEAPFDEMIGGLYTLEMDV
jgi:hypothetical protein